MTSTLIEPVLDESLDFSVPCEYSAHEWISYDTEAAEWIVIMRAPECGCLPMGPRFFCTPCKEWRLEGDRLVYCPECGVGYERTEHLISVERL
jgi:hypothetical protein